METTCYNKIYENGLYSTVSCSKFLVDPYKSREEFVKKLIELRLRYIQSGGRQYSIEEINKELSEEDE